MATLACVVLAVHSRAQESNVNTTTAIDINGHVVRDGPVISRTKSAGASETTFTTQSINGRSVPLEQVEERVLRDDASGKVTERITKRYDPQGNPLPPERKLIEEQKRSDGGSTVQSTTYRGDINGNMQVIEKSSTETQKNGSNENSETVIQRQTVNGLATVEKQSSVVTRQGDNFRAETTVYRGNGYGDFQPAVRRTDEHTVQGSQASDNSAEYERDSYGELSLHGQTVTKTVKRSDGSSDTVVDIYSPNVPGTVPGSGSGLKLQEEQLIENKPGPGDTVVQTLSVRRPSVSDSGTLGPPRELSQTVCKGDCKPPAESNK